MTNKTNIFIIGIFLVLILSACGQKELEGRLDYEIHDFQYVNQDEQAVSLSDLKGKVWIADFVFTHCNTVCPMLTFNMAQLQDEMGKQGLDVTFVSFSVDPERDTPEKLKEYGERFQADFSNWHFLTGYNMEEIKKFATESFKTTVLEDPNSDQVIHGTQFFLIDQDGKMAKYYTGLQEIPIEQIVEDTKIIMNK